MTGKRWAVVVLAVVVGAGIVVQQNIEPTAASDAQVGAYRTITLEVTGMT